MCALLSLVVSSRTPQDTPAKTWDVQALEGKLLDTSYAWCESQVGPTTSQTAPPQDPTQFPTDWKTTCTYRFWTTFAPLFGPVASYRAVLKERENYPNYIQECHHAMHAIGQAAFSALGSYAALRLGDDSCQGGYVHGILQQWTLSGRGEDGVQTVCLPTTPGSKAYAMCGHGLGHAVALRYPTSLTQALKVCEQAAPKDLIGACADGAVMEYSGKDHVTVGIQAVSASRPKDYVTEKDRYNACEVLTDDAGRRSCWEWVHMLIDDSKKDDPTTYAKLCEGATRKGDRDACLVRWVEKATYSVGIVSPRDPQVASKTLPVFEGCEKLSKDRAVVLACQTQLVSNIWRDEPLSSPATSFCPALPERFREGCVLGDARAAEVRQSA